MKAMLLAVAVPALLLAKGPTVKITIGGEGLQPPISITDPKVGEFPVWSGPGVFVNGVEQTEGFIIEWSKGVIPQPPTRLQRYRVSFYTGCKDSEIGCRSTEPRVVYVVSYVYDQVAEQVSCTWPAEETTCSH
jgi:hypothetical protein